MRRAMHHTPCTSMDHAPQGVVAGLPQSPSARLAVIIPCHNSANELKRVVACARHHDTDMEHVRLFAIDSGSTDETWEMVQRMQQDGQVRDFGNTALKGAWGKLNTKSVAETIFFFFGCLFCVGRRRAHCV